ncbi:MAG TPA: VWA domain-containing protein, partial [Devosia sp.]|nr:VWA domain-containing protein [Devosia sp.]
MKCSDHDGRSILKRIAVGSAALLLGSLASGAGTVAQERTMIVLDGSGSMWGQIDGVPKLTIARQTLREVLAGVPGSTELGLLAYGHREKGNCGDIELIVPPATGTAGLIADEVDQMRFLGKTPLTDAVRIAAEELRYTEDKATVVLITDGIETCGANICELGSALEAQGVDFTAHVVGFGVTEEEGRQIACLADNTGGQYFAADDADALVVALNEVVVAPTPETSLKARDQDDNPVNDIALSWEVRDASGAVVAQTTGVGGISGAFEAGDYTVLISGDGVSGGMEFAIEEDAGSQTIYVPVERVILSATLEAPAEVAAGAEFEIAWTGPDDKGDYVTIVEMGADEGRFINYAYTGRGSPALVTAPDGLGVYELRYVHGPTDKTLASREITLTAVSAKLEAPDEVAAGAEFEVVWSGPSNRNDYITIVEAGAPDKEFEDYAYTRNGSPATITAPDGVGAYEVRYVLGQDRRALASRPITLTAVSAKLE